MIKIFSYDRLHEKNVQEDTFGMEFLTETDAELAEGWDLILVKLGEESRQMAVKPPYNSKYNMFIMGNIVHIPEDYLEIIDDYFGNKYKRVKIKTSAETECEIYVEKRKTVF